MSCGILAVLFLVAIQGRVVLARWTPRRLESSSMPKYDWGCGDYDPSTNSSLFAYLWCSSTDLAEASYQTGFIQGIKSGLLHPRAYSAYDIQDAWWLDRGAVVYGQVCEVQSCDDTQDRFFDETSASYKFYGAYFLENYNIAFSGITPNIVAKKYVAYNNQTSRNYDAQYSVVLLTPCLYLWSALAQRLEAEGAIKKTNAYNFWIEDNAPLYPLTPVTIGLLDNSTYVYDKETALKIFRGSMQLEADFFASATPEAVEEQ